MALVGAVATTALSGCLWDETQFFDLRVVNNTHMAVKVQPCWDQYCVVRNGMPVALLRPADSRDEASYWPNIDGGKAAVTVFSATGKRLGCLTTSFGDRQRMGLVRISQVVPCQRPPAGGPPAGP